MAVHTVLTYVLYNKYTHWNVHMYERMCVCIHLCGYTYVRTVCTYDNTSRSYCTIMHDFTKSLYAGADQSSHKVGVVITESH